MLVRAEILTVVKAKGVQHTVCRCVLSRMTGEQERLWASEV